MQELPRIELAHLPTPLDPAPALGRRLGIDLHIKRDDATGLALGGNKARKLEYLLADARARGADTIITFGAVQSNHARMSAAAAARCGLRCHLLLGGARPAQVQGNLLLDRLFGADTEFLDLTPDELTPERVDRAFAEAESRLRATGRSPYRIPAGGSCALGAIAYALAFRETMDQARRAGLSVESVVAAVGTGGTLAGLALGNALEGHPVRIRGISVAPPGLPEAVGIPPARDLARAGLALLEESGLPGIATGAGRPGSVEIDPEDVTVDYAHGGRAYAVPTPESVEAIHLVAREEGLLLDPVYTCKAMAGLIDRARSGTLGRRGSVIFLHTGGAPALFTYVDSLTRGEPTGA